MAEDDQVAALEPPDTPVTQPSAPVQPVQDTTSEHPASALDDPFERAARRTTRGVVHRDPTPIVSSDDQYAALDEGAKYIDPEGGRRTKPYKVADDRDFDRVPEGSHYEDPEGNLRQKPKSEPVNYTAQTLYGMAANKKEKFNALNKFYKGRVKEDSNGEYYVDDDGTIRRPKGFFDAPLAGATAMAAPTLGAVAGELAGIGAGTLAAPGPGTVAGAVLGGAVGAGVGQSFNDLVLVLAGTYDRSGEEQLKETGLAMGLGGAGPAVGRAIGAAGPALKAGAQKFAPKLANKFIETSEEGLETAINIKERMGAKERSWFGKAPEDEALVPVGMWAPRSPYWINMSQIYDAAMRTDEPLLQSAVRIHDRGAREIAARMGIDLGPDVVSKPTAKVSALEAGERLQQKAVQELAEKDAELQKKIPTLRLTGPENDPRALEAATVAARDAAQNVIDAGYQQINRTIQQAMDAVGAGHDASVVWRRAGNELVAIKQGYTARGEHMYDTADQISGGARPDISGLPELARSFVSEIPEAFRNIYPRIVQKLENLGGRLARDEHGQPIPGQWEIEPYNPTFGELRRIRSALRHEADWYTLESDVQNGSFKFFSRRVDEVLHDMSATPELRAAARQLDLADEFWRDNAQIFNSRQIEGVMKGLRAGEPADAKKLFDLLIQSNNSSMTNRLMNMLDPATAAAVRMSDVEALVNQSRTLIPGMIDGSKFSSEVLKRHQHNMLLPIHGQVGERLLQQAQRIEAFEGRIPIHVAPTDRAMDIISRALNTARIAEEAAKRNPLKVWEADVKNAIAANKKARIQDMRSDPLKNLLEPGVGGNTAAEKILASDDMLLAVADRYGMHSQEFDGLRQVYTKRFLAATLDPGKENLPKVAPEIQAIMWPGISTQEMQTLAKEMGLIMEQLNKGGTGQSMQAQTRVTNPWSQLPLHHRGLMKMPGVGMVGRKVLGRYYQLATDFSNNIALMKWLMKGFKGDPEAVARSRAVIQHMMARGQAAGASIGGAIKSFPSQPGMPGDIEETSGDQPQQMETFEGGRPHTNEAKIIRKDPYKTWESDQSHISVAPMFRTLSKSGNRKGMEALLEHSPESKNVDDRRGKKTIDSYRDLIEGMDNEGYSQSRKHRAFLKRASDFTNDAGEEKDVPMPRPRPKSQRK